MRNLIISMAIIAIFLEISGLIWSAKGDRPSETYIQLTQTPEKQIHTVLQNGYLMMVGFAAASTADPVQTGYDIWMEADADRSHRVFDYRKPGRSELRIMIDAGEAFPAWTAADPLSAFRQPDAMFRLSLDRYVILLDRYTRLLAMPVEDWDSDTSGIRDSKNSSSSIASMSPQDLCTSRQRGSHGYNGS